MRHRLSTFASPVWLLPVALLAVSTAAANTRYEGLAYAKGTQRLLYTEEHWLKEDGAERLVLYRCPTGEPFARKRVRGKGPAPDFEFIDARTGYAEGVRSGGTGREVFTREAAGAAEQRSPIRPDEALVIDAGFDSFVRQQWDALTAARPARLRFLIPSRREAIRFRVAPGSDSGGTRSFRLSFDAWYGRALPSLEVTYSARGDRLLRFEGIGNIRDSAGQYQPVRIEFPANRRSAANAPAQALAAAAPLVSSCGAA